MKWTKVIGFAIVTFAPCILVAYAIGAIGTGVSSGGGNFGYYSLNMNALYNPISYKEVVWSNILNPIPTRSGNYEDGFNYLGFGILAGLVAVLIAIIVKKIKIDLIFIKRNIGMIIASVVFYIFALSNVVTFNETVLFTIPLPEPIFQVFSVFRASSRMFYPDFYLIILLVIWAMIKLVPKDKIIIAIVLLIGIQMFDLFPGLERKHSDFNLEALEKRYETEYGNIEQDWQILTEDYKEIKAVEYSWNPVMAAFVGKANLKHANVYISSRGNFDMSFSENARDEVINDQMQEGVLYTAVDINTANILGKNISNEYAVYQMMDNFVIAKRNDKLSHVEYIPDGSISLSNFTDVNWENGVLKSDSTMWLFEYNALVEDALCNHKYLKSEKGTYLIQSVYAEGDFIQVKVDKVEDVMDVAYPVRLYLVNE